MRENDCLKNPDRCLFEEDKEVYKVINFALLNIGKVGFYDAIFTDEYGQLEEEDKNMVIGVITGDYGLSFKDFIDFIIEEKNT
jgi:hypothetical protein